jgi:hypothetical protein
MAAKTLKNWHTIEAHEKDNFDQLRNMQITTGNNLNNQEQIMMHQLRNTLNSLQRESNANSSLIDEYEKKLRSHKMKLQELANQHMHETEFERKSNASLDHCKDNIQILQADLQKLRERDPILVGQKYRSSVHTCV